MVVSVQPLLGKGTRKRKSSDAEPGCNMLGDSLLTRLLYSVMLGRVYNSRKAKGKPLSLLVKNLSLELRDAFFNGVELAVGDDVRKYFLVPYSCKGRLASTGQSWPTHQTLWAPSSAEARTRYLSPVPS